MCKAGQKAAFAPRPINAHVASQTPYRSAVSKNAKEERGVSSNAVSFDGWKSCPVCRETARRFFVSRKLPSARDLSSLSLSSGSLQADFRRHYLLAGRFFSSPSPSFARSCVITALLLGFELGEPTRNVAVLRRPSVVWERAHLAQLGGRTKRHRNSAAQPHYSCRVAYLLRHICNW